MELRERLAETAKRQHEEADLPAWTLAAVLDLTAAPQLLDDSQDLVEQLLRQIENFDSYAGAGCFGDSASAADIEATLNKFRPKPLHAARHN